MFIDRCCDMKDDQNMMKQNYDIPAYDMPNSNMCCPMPMMCPPIYECPQERCCHREIIHEVPHIIPINTRIINHHIYRHTYIPRYTCCEENEVSNIYDRNCGC